MAEINSEVDVNAGPAAIVPQRPKGADAAKVTEMQQKAEQISGQINAAPNDFEVSALMRTFGQEARARMETVNQRLGQQTQTLLKSFEGEESPVAGKLLDLRAVMEELNPHSLSKSWWFGWMPTRIQRHLIRRFAGRWQSEQTNITAILDGLRSGQDSLLEQTLALHVQYKELDAAQREVKEWIYVGELVWERLNSLLSAANDETDRKKLEAKLSRVARRVRDLRTMEQSNLQFGLTITQTLETNDLLSEQVQSALLIGPSVLENGLRIHSALAKQRQVARALGEFQGTLGTMMTENAAALNQQAVEIGELYNNPVIALDKLGQAHDQLMATVKTVQATIKTGTAKAREASAKLAEMSRQMEPIVNAQREALEPVTVERPQIAAEQH